MKRDHRVIILFFIIPLFVFALLSAAWPKQAVSKDENRQLAQFPALSWSALASGKWTQEYENYYSDQFPLRNFFMGAHRLYRSLLTTSGGDDIDLIHVDVGTADEGEGVRPDTDGNPTDPATSAVDGTTAVPSPPPTTTTSAATGTAGTTGAAPSATPSAGTSTIPTETAGTTATPETTPATLPSIDDAEATKVMQLLLVGDRAMEFYTYNAANTQRYFDDLKKLRDKLPDQRFILLVAPTAIEFYAPERYHSGKNSQKTALADIYSKLSDRYITVDAYSKIVEQVASGAYLYFRTDHHWTARGAYQAYRAFCEATGQQATPLDNMQAGRVPGDFFGTFMKASGNHPKLKANPDYVETFLPTVQSSGQVYREDGATPWFKIQAVNPQYKGSSNLYLAFIGGDAPLTRFTSSLTNGRRVLVVKESYGNAMVPFLLENYQEVLVVDPRKLKASLVDLVNKNDIDDVLIINYAFGLTNPSWLAGLERITG